MELISDIWPALWGLILVLAIIFYGLVFFLLPIFIYMIHRNVHKSLKQMKIIISLLYRIEKIFKEKEENENEIQ